jgi:hypothetical protein
MNDDKQKLCKDCLHFKPAPKVSNWTLDESYASHKCTASPHEASIELVCGTVRVGSFRYCIARRRDAKSKCGPSGKQFRPAK